MQPAVDEQRGHALLGRLKSTTSVCLILMAFSVAFLISRISIIEGDLAPFQFTHVQKIDSVYYVLSAFEWLEGRYEPEAIRNTISALPNGLFYNALVYLNLAALGDNYYGFRLNVVLVSLVSSLIFSYLFYLRYSISALIISLPIFLLSFPWFVASLEVEPTIYRIFHMAAVAGLLIWLEYKGWAHRFWGAFLISTVAISGPLFIYPTNFFILPALVAYYLLKALQRGHLRSFGLFLLAAVSALFATVILWALLSTLAFGGLAIILEFFSTFTPRVTQSNTLDKVWLEIVGKFWIIPTFSLFRDAPFAFYTYLTGLGVMTGWLVIRSVAPLRQRLGMTTDWRESIPEIFSLMSVLFFCQTLFVNDYPLKKLTFLVPFIIFGALFLFEMIEREFRLPAFIPALAFVIFLVTPSFKATHQYLFVEYTEKMKTAMIELRAIGNAKVVGGVGHSFRLYNSFRPYLPYYVYAHVLHDMLGFNKVMEGPVSGVDPEYTIGIMVNDEMIKYFLRLGFVLDRMLISWDEEGVGNVALFRKVGRPSIWPMPAE